MAFDVGSVVAHIKADLTDFNNGMNEAKNKANGFASHLQGVGDSIAGFGKQAAIFTGVIAGGIGALSLKGIKTAAEYERLETAFQTVTGSADDAAKAMATVKKAAKDSPFFEVTPLANFVQLMAASGQKIDTAVESGLKFGDVAAAFGKGNGEMTRMGNTLSQVMGKGKADIIDFKELVNAGWVRVRGDVAESMGISMAEFEEMVSAGEIGYEDIAKAAERYAGSAAAQSGNLTALWSRFNETISTGLAEIITKSGAFDLIKQGLERIIPFLETLSTKIVEFINSLKTNEQFQAFIAGLVTAFQQVSAWISENQELVLTFLKGLAIAVGALLVIGTVTALIAALTNPLVLVALAIAALYTAWQTNFLGIRDITTTVVNAVVDFFTNTFMPFIMVFVNWFVERWTFIQLMIEGVWNIIIGIIQLAWAIIYGIISVGMELLAGDWAGAWERVKQTVSMAWDGIKRIFTGILQFIVGWGGNLLSELVRPFSDAWKKIEEFVKKIKDALDFTKRHSPSVVDIVNKGVREVNKAMNGLEFTTNIAPRAAAAIVGSGGSTNVANVTVDLSGAIITDELAAMRIGEKIGDSIISKLQLNVRF